MTHALVCPDCGGVHMPAQIGEEKMCATPGCAHQGKALEPREISEDETMICPVCQGTFMKISSHHH